MKITAEILAFKMAERHNISRQMARKMLFMLSDTIKSLIDEGCTSFRFPSLFTLEFSKLEAVTHYDINSKRLEMGRPRIRARVIFGKALRERIRKAFDIKNPII